MGNHVVSVADYRDLEMALKNIYDFAITIDWEYDWDFARMLEIAAQALGLTTYIVSPEILEDVYRKLTQNEISFRFLLDRASDTSPEFCKLQKFVIENNGGVFEPAESLRWASDKATMHLEFISRGLHTPYTIILPPVDSIEHYTLTLDDLTHLGRPFIIKPANTTGGGIGVVNGAETLQDVLTARQEYRTDKYLLQEKVKPLEAEDRRFWFRGFYTCGMVQCAWWNDLNHRYRQLAVNEIQNFKLKKLFTIVRQIAEICKLHFFSTEIALTPDGDFIIVDYVNDSCDMRLQSRAADGVPDAIVRRIADKISRYVKRQLKGG